MRLAHAPHPEEYRQARQVLVCMPWGVGDTVMQRPLLAAVHRAAPRAAVTVLGAEPAIELLADKASCEVKAYQSLGVQHCGQEPDEAVDQVVLRWLASRVPFDHIFNCRVAPAAVRHAIWNSGLATLEPDQEQERLLLSRGGGCASAWLEAASAGWRIPIDPRLGLRLDPPAWARQRAEDFLAMNGLADDLPAAISPVGCLQPGRWPASHLAQIGDRLIETTKNALLLVEGGDTAAAEATLSQMEHRSVVVRFGRLHLLETAAILQRCRVLVCNDTGLLHIAAAVGTPVVGIYGPTPPEALRPHFPWVVTIGEPATRLEQSAVEVGVASCWQGEPISDGNGISQVDVEDVWEALEGLIPLTTASAAMHPSHGKLAGAGRAGAGREEGPKR
jgi:hypothetical protein